MGAFDFIKNVGAKLGIGGSSTPDAESIKAAIVESGVSVEGLTVDVKDGVAVIGGNALTQEAREKAILVAGNVEGIGQVQEEIAVAAAEPEATFYTVQKGDTLSAIAKTHYGNANKYMEIFEANKPMLTGPDKIYPGQMLRIPQAH